LEPERVDEHIESPAAEREHSREQVGQDDQHRERQRQQREPEDGRPTGREAVLGPISRSMSRSSTWLSALAPPHDNPPPTTSAARGSSAGSPPDAATIAHTAVSTSSDMIRGLVSVM